MASPWHVHPMSFMWSGSLTQRIWRWPAARTPAVWPAQGWLGAASRACCHLAVSKLSRPCKTKGKKKKRKTNNRTASTSWHKVITAHGSALHPGLRVVSSVAPSCTAVCSTLPGTPHRRVTGNILEDQHIHFHKRQHKSLCPPRLFEGSWTHLHLLSDPVWNVRFLLDGLCTRAWEVGSSTVQPQPRKRNDLFSQNFWISLRASEFQGIFWHPAGWRTRCKRWCRPHGCAKRSASASLTSILGPSLHQSSQGIQAVFPNLLNTLPGEYWDF